MYSNNRFSFKFSDILYLINNKYRQNSNKTEIYRFSKLNLRFESQNYNILTLNIAVILISIT